MIYIEENMEHEVAELMCVKCMYRWIGAFPSSVSLKEIECPCGETGYVIKTGQTLPDDIVTEKMEQDIRFINLVKQFGREEAIEKYKMFILGQE